MYRTLMGLVLLVALGLGILWAISISESIPLPSPPPPPLEYSLIPDTNDPLIVADAFFECTERSVSHMSVSISNLTGSPLSILWDESSIILPNDISKRIIHTGVAYSRKMEEQLPTIVPPHAKVVETIWPTELTSWSDIYNKWIEAEIPVAPGDVLSLYLTWESPEGKQWHQWTWMFQKAGPD